MRMKKKIVWILVSCLMVLSLVIASCGPKQEAKTEEAGKATVVTAEEEEAAPAEEAAGGAAILAPEVPKYGGTLNMVFREPMGFDPYYTFMMMCGTLYMCNEQFIMGDWAKGPAGTGETDWVNGFLGFMHLCTGMLCENWEIKDAETVVFHVRHGVHWWNKAPANGREFTADDAVWNILRLWQSPTGVHRAITAPDERILSAKALDKYTVEVKFNAPALGNSALIYTGSWLYMIPPEVVSTYGDMKDWKHVIGTGPFMLTDYVAGSALTFEKNPNYWLHDPIHPENQLPYVDSVTGLIVLDTSTQLAALRTGKLDFSFNMDVTWENGLELMNQCPDLESKTLSSMSKELYFRVDKQDLPFKDLKVRQALVMAINHEDIIKNYYGGHAWIDGQVFPPLKAWEAFHVPFDQLPQATQDLFAYNPDKAKDLLKEAGYPDGFKCSIISGSPGDTDFLSMIKSYFEKVNVDMSIQQLESSIFNSQWRARSYEQGIYMSSPTAMFPYDMHSTRIESFDDLSYYENPTTRAAYNEMRTYVGLDDVKYAATLKGIEPFIIDQCVGIWVPLPQSYRLWWPWCQNYHGEGSLGCDQEYFVTTYIWLDQALKKSMGY
jgi:peptide/nickel transport system substrate-binding protein